MNTYPNQQRTNKEFTLAAGDTHVANFVDARKGLPFNSATIEQLQKPNYVTSTVASIAGAQVCAPYSDIQGEKRAQSPSTSGRGVGVRGRLDSHQVVTTSETQNDHGEISSVARFRNKFGMTSPSKGMSEAKAEQQSTETLSFRCWCEGCHLSRGRIGGQNVEKNVWCTHLRTEKKQAAFTLAEVLITLGIIGVVAALTLPALLVKTKTSEYSARLKKFYSTMNQTIKMSELDNGPCEYWDYEKMGALSNGEESEQEEKDQYAQESSDKASAFLDKYIIPYVKGEKVDNFKWETMTLGLNIKAPGVKFPDGSAMYLKTGSCFDILFDVNGSNPPNEKGVDQFNFVYCNKENSFLKGQCFTPYVTQRERTNDRDWFVEKCATQNYYCAALLFIDGWEFKKDYPYKLK